MIFILIFLLIVADAICYLKTPSTVKMRYAAWLYPLPFSGLYFYYKYKSWRFGIKKKIIYRSNEVPYLIRWSIFSTPFFAIKLHKILLSDDACFHDHPWSFISLILKGGYREYFYTQRFSDDTPIVNCNEPLNMDYVNFKTVVSGDILFRKANWAHRLELEKPATTLVITFKKIRVWGFFTPSGWVKFYKYEQGSNKCE